MKLIKHLKLISLNIYYFALINVILFVGHFWAFCGVAFNDTGVQYNSITEALPVILFGVAPLLFGSIILTVLFVKSNFKVHIFWILQTFVIICWILFYIINYVPNSKITLYFNQIQDIKSIKYQDKINEKVLNELEKGYLLIDSIKENDKEIKLYFNKDAKKLIVELNINDEKNYNIIDSYKKNSDNTDIKEKISMYNSNIYFNFDKYGNMSICFDKECYYFENNCVINENNYNYSDGLSVYHSNGNTYKIIDEYKKMIENSIINADGIYYLNDVKLLNIKLIEGGVKIFDGSIDNKNYYWIIKRNNEFVFKIKAKTNELIFARDLTEEEIYNTIGNYEIYLETWFDSLSYDSSQTNYLGYTKISNSVFFAK